MIGARHRRRLAVSTALSALALAAVAGSALAAYPPGKPPPPRARCAISTIVDRRVAISCNAGKARAGEACSISLRKTIVARGRVSKNGLFFARFAVPTYLTRGTVISFVVLGKIVATLRV